MKINLSNKVSIDLPKIKMSTGIEIYFFNPWNMDYYYKVTNALLSRVKDKDSIYYNIDTVVVPANKPICLAMFLAANIHAKLLVLKKEVKPYHKDILWFSRSAESMTSDSECKFFIEKSEVDLVKGKNVLFFDDVCSRSYTWQTAKSFLLTLNPKSFHSLFLFKEGHTSDKIFENDPDAEYIAYIPTVDEIEKTTN